MIEPVRVVQIKAQAMQTFVIVNVYVMLYSLYTIVLDVSKPLELIIPIRRQLGSEDPDPVSQSHDVLQPATREARKLLGKAMSERYFKWYHPILALCQPKKIYENNLGRPMLLKNVLEETDFKFSYLIDAESMLYSPMTSGKILAKLINATNIDRLDISCWLDTREPTEAALCVPEPVHMEQNQMFSEDCCSADCVQETANGREYPSSAT
jgi:hypothetical protein